MKTITFSLGEHRHQVTLTAVNAGDGLVVVVTGGDKPHIGAVAISLTAPSLKELSKPSVTTSVITRLGHKDDIVAKSASEKLANVLDKAIVAVTGLHIENATDKDIDQIVSNSNRAVDELIKKLRVLRY